jgi:hypothetical protein
MDIGKRLNELNETIKNANFNFEIGLIGPDELYRIAQKVKFEHENLTSISVNGIETTDKRCVNSSKLKNTSGQNDASAHKIQINKWIEQKKIPGGYFLFSLN